MSDNEISGLLLAAARRDLLALGNMCDSQAFPGEIFGFHAQQSVEKALKAWLAWLGKECPRTHNIRHLLLLLEETGIPVDSLWGFVELTAFAVQFRYEAYEVLDEPLDRSKLLAEIHDLVAQVSAVLANP
ncbi:HEPN domain-containing protein [Geoalkalibacter sp.]|uniref:HEPN domain-containing protein n=1 Tax=Geoalkalibacter sp. TaxID=3041440 RepID=UPI00272E86CF|nr:HEPN domain-containing protein [Geoalkalibacter sp.]